MAISTNILLNPYAVETVNTLLSRLPDPDYLLEKVSLARADLKKIEETDDEIAAALETRHDAIISTPWRLHPFEGADIEWLWEAIEPHVDAILSGAWQAVPYGYSVIELVYRKDAGRFAIDNASEKPIEWFEPKRDGTLMYYPPDGGFGSSVSGVGETVDSTYKFIVTRRGPTYRNPYGKALLSLCYWPWFFRYNGWRYWMRFLERFADPFIVGQTSNPEEFVQRLQAADIINSIGVGTDEKVSVVSPGQAGEFEKVESVLRDRIQRTILGQTLTSQVGDKGSYAAAKVHDGVRDDKRTSDIRLIRGSMQRVINALWDLNKFAGKPPTFILQDDTGLEESRATRDATLVNAGILRFTQRYIQSAYDLEPDDFEIPADNPANPPVAPGNIKAAVKPTGWSFAASKGDFTPEQQAIEKLADAAIKAAPPLIPEDAIRSAILASKDPDDLESRLSALALESDAGEFRELLERALFAADIMGYAHAGG